MVGVVQNLNSLVKSPNLLKDILSREDDGKMSIEGGPQPSQLQFFFFFLNVFGLASCEKWVPIKLSKPKVDWKLAGVVL